jgi:hypothetical protein
MYILTLVVSDARIYGLRHSALWLAGWLVHPYPAPEVMQPVRGLAAAGQTPDTSRFTSPPLNLLRYIHFLAGDIENECNERRNSALEPPSRIFSKA